jgi:hypothetical protein
MNNLTRWVLLGYLCTAPAWSVPPGKGADPRDAMARELLDLAGTRRQILELPGVIKASLQLSKGSGLNQEVYDMLQKAAEKTLDGEEMYRIVYDYFRRTGTADHLHEAIELARSPLILKFTQWEVDASTAEAVTEMRDYISKLSPKLNDPDRFKLLNAIDEMSGGSELAVEMEVITSLESAKAAQAGLPPEKQTSRAQLEREAQELAKKIRPTMKTQAIATALFTYRRASNAELRHYAALLSSPTGKWLARTAITAGKKALDRAMAKLSQEFIHSLEAKIAKNKKGANGSTSNR